MGYKSWRKRMKNYKNYVTSGEFRNLLRDQPVNSLTEHSEYLTKNDYYKVVQEIQREKFDIRNYIDVIDTPFRDGTRPFQNSSADEFHGITNVSSTTMLETVEFYGIDYNIKKFIGFTEITGELLEDSEENTMDFITKWFAQHTLNTYIHQVFNGKNNKTEAEGIFTDIATGDKLESRVERLSTLPTIKDFRRYFTKDLDTILNTQKKIFTNADGFNFLENLEDAAGKTFVKADTTKKSGWSFLERELVEIPAVYFRNTPDGTPFILGDLKVLYKLFHSDGTKIESSGHTKNGWSNSLEEVKGTINFDGAISEDIETVKIIFAKVDSEEL